jgi:hypothetical protein
MPVFLWWNAISSLDIWSKAFRLFRKSQKNNGVWIEVLCYSLGSMAMVRKKYLFNLLYQQR